MDKLEDIQAFIAVVDAGSYTVAAQRLEVAKSVVSRRVSALEQRLGVQLLRRTTRVLNLTDSGRGFYERGTRILADLAEAEAAVRQRHTELRGTLRVVLPLSFGVRHLCGPIAKFQKRHPEVELDLDLTDRTVDIVEEQIDVALCFGQPTDATLIAQRLFDVRHVVCAAPHYLSTHGVPETPDDLRDHQCLVQSNSAESDEWQYQDPNSGRRAAKVNVAMSTSSGDFLCNAAAHGQGIVMQPTFIVSEAIRRGSLIPILTDYTWPTSPAFVAYSRTRHLSFRVRAFIGLLTEKFKGQPQWDRDCET